MKSIILITSLLFAHTVFADAKDLCYGEYSPAVINKQSEIISQFTELVSNESNYIDMIFNPIKYTRGPHNPVIIQGKNSLLQIRFDSIEHIKQLVADLTEVENDLKYCLKFAKK